MLSGQQRTSKFFKVEQDSEWKELYLPMLKDFYMNEFMRNFYTKEDKHF